MFIICLDMLDATLICIFTGWVKHSWWPRRIRREMSWSICCQLSICDANDIEQNVGHFRLSASTLFWWIALVLWFYFCNNPRNNSHILIRHQNIGVYFGFGAKCLFKYAGFITYQYAHYGWGKCLTYDVIFGILFPCAKIFYVNSQEQAIVRVLDGHGPWCWLLICLYCWWWRL